MKVALLINRDNYEKYASWEGTGWDLIHLGNGAPEPEKVTATGADVLVVDAIMKIGTDIIRNMPGLKLIHSQGVAFNGIDLSAAKDAGIYVCNCAGVNAQPVAEHAVLLILALLKSFRYNEDMVYSNKQFEAKTACFKDGLPELFGRRVGIVGLGAIGGALANMLQAFGCDVCYYTRSGDRHKDGMTFMPLRELYTSCDIVSLNVPVTPETTNMINSETLALFKRGAILVNTARGELMDHSAVVGALISGQLGGLCADTLAPEPFMPDNPILCDLPEHLRSHIVLSPHIAGITAGCFIRAFALIRKNIEAISNGDKPGYIVNL